MRDAGGRFCSGIHTIDDLKKRCEIDEDTGCWTYQGAKKPWSTELRRAVHLTTLIGRLIEGDWPKPGRFWYPTCGNDRCCNPAHRQRATWAQVMKREAAKRSPEYKARLADACRRAGRLTPEQRLEISHGHEPLNQISKRLGITYDHAWKIRSRNTDRKNLPASSVFTWRP